MDFSREASDADLCKAPSLDFIHSLLPTRVRPKRPNKLVTVLRDQYWEKATSNLMKRAHAIEPQLQAFEKEYKAPVNPADKSKLLETRDSVLKTGAEYDSAVDSHEALSARNLSLRLEEGVYELVKLSKLVFLRALEDRDANKAYLPVSSKVLRHLIFTAKPGVRSNCDPALREPNFQRLFAWLEDGHSKRPIHWVSGPSRCGKSTFLQHIAAVYQRVDGALVASFHFPYDFTTPQLNDHFLPTLLEQLAVCIPGLKKAVVIVRDETRADQQNLQGLMVQAESLFVPVLRRLQSEGNMLNHPLIFLDGLDRLGQGTLSDLLDFIALTISKIPVYYIIASCKSDDPNSSAYVLSNAQVSNSFFHEHIEVNELVDYREVYPKGTV